MIGFKISCLDTKHGEFLKLWQFSGSFSLPNFEEFTIPPNFYPNNEFLQ